MFLTFKIIELDEKIIYILYVVNFIDLFEFFNQANARNIKNIIFQLNLAIKKVDSCCYILFLVEYLEVDISKIHNEDIDDIFLVLLQIMEKFLFFLLYQYLCLFLAHLQLFRNLIRQIFYLFDLRTHFYMYHHKLALFNIYSINSSSARIEMLEVVRKFCVLVLLVVRIKLIKILCKSTDLKRSFCKKCF